MNDNQPTVTITADEYFELRAKAESQAYLTRNIEYLSCKIDGLTNRVLDLELLLDRNNIRRS